MNSPAPADLLALFRRDDALPQGQRVALLLGKGVSAPAGLRAVSGTVVGYTVRPGAQVIDLVLREISTWLYRSAHTHADVLPPQDKGYFRVVVNVSVEATLNALAQSTRHGRSLFAAAEIPFEHCPACGTRCGVGHAFCAECGTRLGVGDKVAILDPPEPSEIETSCPSCWDRKPKEGKFCARCGYDRRWPEILAGLAGQEVKLDLVAGRERKGRIHAMIRRVEFRRLQRFSSPALIARISDISTLAPGAETLPAGFATVVTISAWNGDARESLSRLQSGEPLRATEILVRCPHCAVRLGWTRVERGGHRPAHIPAEVSGTHCIACGGRVRIFAHHGHPSTHRRPARGPFAGVPGIHACGSLYGRKHRHCGGCGNEIDHSAYELEGWRAEAIGEIVQPAPEPSAGYLEEAILARFV